MSRMSRSELLATLGGLAIGFWMSYRAAEQIWLDHVIVGVASAAIGALSVMELVLPSPPWSEVRDAVHFGFCTVPGVLALPVALLPYGLYLGFTLPDERWPIAAAGCLMILGVGSALQLCRCRYELWRLEQTRQPTEF